MANLWNIRNLPLPVRKECRIDDRELDIKHYLNILRDAIKSFQHPHLEAEATLLSRCIYRMKTKFRNDKGLKELQKINISLRRYLTLDAPLALQRFLKTLPTKKFKSTQYPTLGNLDYLLTRLQGTVKLLARTAECTKYSAHYLLERISIGHFWNTTCITLAIVARVFVLVKNAVKICCRVYNDLFGLRGFLQGTSGYETEENKFPEDLRVWLDDDWIFDAVITEEIEEKLSKVRKRDDVEFCGDYVEIDDDVDFIDEYIDTTPKAKAKSTENGNKKPAGQVPNIENGETILIEPDDVNSSDLNTQVDDKLIQVEDVAGEIKSDEDIGEVVPKSLTKPKLKMSEPQSLGKKQKLNKPQANVNANGKRPFDKAKEVKTNSKQVNKNRIKKRKHENNNITENTINAINVESPENGNKQQKKHKHENNNITENTINANNVEYPENGNKQKLKKTKNDSPTNKNDSSKSSLSIRDTINSITSIVELKRFVKRESKLRDINLNKCKMKHLDKMQWNMLSKSVNGIVNKSKRVEGKDEVFLKRGKNALLTSIK